MQSRPRSIVNFERCYLGAFVLGFVNTVLAWSDTQATIAASDAGAAFGGSFLIVTTALGFAITLALWYFIARRGSAVAKWIATVFLALGVLGLVFALLMRTYPAGIGGVVGIVTTVLQAVAISFLFRADTKPWFGETAEPIV